jgi:hypothetical protein
MEWTSATGRKIVLLEGDITRVPVDAIVNAARRDRDVTRSEPDRGAKDDRQLPRLP